MEMPQLSKAQRSREILLGGLHFLQDSMLNRLQKVEDYLIESLKDDPSAAA